MGSVFFVKMGRSHFDFNKTKINLKLALNRMKIQKNKQSNQIKAGRRAIAELLKEGKEDVARVKVEAVIRDDMMLQALEILDLFVELLLSRVELLKMQTGCPFDMKEAVCTVIYAAPRVNAKELTEVRHQFIEKFGKPFASEAMENKGNCVNSKLIRKMSIIPFENATIFEYLESISKEHKLDWKSPLSAAPGEMDMFPTPPNMAAPLQPQPYVASPYPPQQMHPQQPYAPPPSQGQPVLPGANYNSNSNLASMFPTVPGPAPQAYASPPPPQANVYQHHQMPPPPMNNNNTPPPPDYANFTTPGNPNDDVPGMDDLLARFQNLKK